MRLKFGGSNAGHNGLGNIQSVLGTDRYSRLRVGIGNDFPRGMQVQWVLGRYDDEDIRVLEPKIETACEMIKSFVLTGVDFTMNAFNKKK
jgi:PTH1 family peptidyl-tRNA hydrolase